MAKLFIGISAAFMLATAVVSFMLKGKVDALQTGRKDAIGKIQMAEAKAKTAQNAADKATAEAKDATDKLGAANDAKTAAEKKADDCKRSLDEANLVLEKTKKDLETAMANPNKGPATPDPKVLELQAQLTDMTTQKENALKERDEAKAAFDSCVAKGKANEDALVKLQRAERDRDLKLGKAGLRARILAVNGGWNFVVLSVGDKQGVSVDDPLIVVRGSEPVAKLRITSVEPSTSIADVIPSTVRRGISIQPGDTVIFQGRTQSVQPESKPAAEAPTNVTTAPLQPGQ
jgi:hypothetical protein